MASTTEGRYSRFLRRALLWAVGAGVVAGAAIAAILFAGGRASAQPLTIPGVGTIEVPDQFSFPGIEVPADGRSSETAPAEVPGKELSAPPAVPGSEPAAPLSIPGNELSIPSTGPGGKFSAPLAVLNIERAALPSVSTIGVASSDVAPVAVQGKELSAPLNVSGLGFAVPLRALGVDRSALPLIPAVENPVAVSERAPVEVRGKELSIPLAIPGVEISIPLGVLGMERSAPRVIPDMERSAPQTVPGAGRPVPFAVQWGVRSAPDAGWSATAEVPGAEPVAPATVPGAGFTVPVGVPGAESVAPATIPGTGITVPADMFRNELAFLTGMFGIKPPASPSTPAVTPERTHGAIAVDAARGKVGREYSMGATGPDAFDCSGLVQWSYDQAGVKVPRTSYEQLSSGTPVSRDELELGDVVSFYDGGHTALYAGDGKVIHASTYGTGVIMSPMSSMPFAGARRY